MPSNGFDRFTLITRALEEDHAANWARSVEARIAHRALADLMRRKAEELARDPERPRV